MSRVRPTMSIRRRLVVAQVLPLVAMALVGIVCTAALVRVDRVLSEVRTHGMRRMEALVQAIDRFREEVVLMQRFRQTGDATWAEAARQRSREVRAQLGVAESQAVSSESSIGGELAEGTGSTPATTELLLGDYEALAGLTGPSGDPDEADRAARHLLRVLRTHRQALEWHLQVQLAAAAEASRATATVMVGAVGLLLLAGTAITLRTGRALARDLAVLERGTNALAAGDFGHRIHLDRPDEFGRLAEAFNRMAGRIDELDRIKAEFLANISHDLKTPLTAIVEAADLLEEEVPGPLNARQHRLTTVLRENSRRLRSLVDNVLDLNRLAGRAPLLAPGDVVEAVDAVLADLSVLAERKGVSLLRTGEADLPPVLLDRGLLEQVLLNLVGNALKFSPREGTVTVEVGREDARELVVAAPGAVRVTVRDQGPGVPVEWRDKVFERFVQVPGHGDRSGTGLGLAICRQIIENHGGRIRIDDAPGGGAAVSFTLVVAA